jgi:uncharacterized surface protein with fasciclin (FAS1) repeats
MFVQAQEPNEDTIYDVLSNNEDFSTLTTAIEIAGLEDELADPDATYTLFAPTNTAFEALLESMDMTAEDFFADEALVQDYLSYHILPDMMVTSDIDTALEDQPLLFTDSLYGALIRINTIDGSVFINGNAVVSANIMASNGVIHALGVVLTSPQPIWETLEATASDEEAPEFTILTEAIRIAKLDADLASPDASFTLFAPTDAAFEAAAEALNLAPSDLLADPDFVAAILQGHLVESELTSVDLIAMYVEAGAPFSLDALNSDATLEISIDDEGLLVGNVRIVEADILTRNGVIHVIDQVLIPEAQQ